MKQIISRCLFRNMVLTMFLSAFFIPAFAVTPQEAFNNAKSKITSAKTISASFTMKINGQSVSGTIQSKGSKFAIISGLSSNWYNGKDLYTYLPSKSETTVFNPSASELREVNPLMYISSASDYKVTGTKTKTQGLETIVLLPTRQGSNVKSVTIDLDAKTFLPKKIKVVPSSGGPIEVTLTNVKLNTQIPDNNFVYPKSKYSKARIIDMR